MFHRTRWYLLPLLAAIFVSLAGVVPAAAATPAAPLSSPGEAIALLGRLVPVLEAAGAHLGLFPSPAPLSDDGRGEAVNATTSRDETDPNHLPAPDEVPARNGGYGGWGDEGSGPWPRS